jgi:hypothetical protein
MPEELPDILVAAFKAQERIVAEIDPLLAHHDVHLHCHMFKATDKALAQVLQIVIAHYQIDLTIQAVEHLFIHLSHRFQFPSLSVLSDVNTRASLANGRLAFNV